MPSEKEGRGFVDADREDPFLGVRDWGAGARNCWEPSASRPVWDTVRE